MLFFMTMLRWFNPSFAPERRLRLFGMFAACLLVFPAALPAAAPAQPSHVQASLVAAESSIQPGRPFTVALRLVHESHWHTYWLNPGTGLATTIAWTLPEGFTAGEIQWPAPIVLKDSSGAIVGNGYEGEMFLLVTITPPASLSAGANVELKADAEWLMCSDVCIPGNADLTLSLPVSSEPPQPNSEWSTKIAATAAALPRARAEWTVNATRDAEQLTLTLTPASGVAHTPERLHFFSDDNLVAYDLPQDVKADGRGGYVLTAPISPDAPENPTHAHGVLTSENGWLSGDASRGLRVDVALAAATAATGAATP
ncbi:MAG TPA: protein-disulfide reductase DsbD domain-containing protein, partial [Opitutus sp.]|nr:protein-disulfide reductase DsbD domain-containing protein [Opitutus sp.]